MPDCHEMKTNEVYGCNACGLEVTVTKECKDAGQHTDASDCCNKPGDCTLVCCGKPLEKK